MWDLIVSVPDHCLSFYFSHLFIHLDVERSKFDGFMTFHDF